MTDTNFEHASDSNDWMRPLLDMLGAEIGKTLGADFAAKVEAPSADAAKVSELEVTIAQLRSYIEYLEGLNRELYTAYVKRTQQALGAGLVRFVMADKV